MNYIYNKENCNLLFTIDSISKLEGVIILENCIVTDKPYAYPVEKNGEIVEATKIELYKKGVYKLQPGEIIKNHEIIYIPEPQDGYPYKWSGREWIKSITLEEEVEELKRLIIEKTKEIEIEKLAGFGSGNLELELDKLKKQHLEKSHELALQIENRLREV